MLACGSLQADSSMIQYRPQSTDRGQKLLGTQHAHLRRDDSVEVMSRGYEAGGNELCIVLASRVEQGLPVSR